MGLRFRSKPHPAKDLTPGAPQNFVAYAASSTVFVLTWQEDPNKTLPDDFDLDFSTGSAVGPWIPIPINLAFTYNHTGQDVTVRHWWRLVAKHAGFASNSTITTAIAYRPVFTVAPTSISFPSIGGTLDFDATDVDGGLLTYSLAFRYRSDIIIDSITGVVTVPSSAAGTSGNIIVRVTDSIGLYAETTCALTVSSSPFMWPPQGIVAYTPIVRGLRAAGADNVGGSGRAYGVNYTVGQTAPTSVTIRRVTGATAAARGTSFIAAVNRHNTESGPSLIVFDVSGALDLGGTDARVRRGLLTIAGHTAPNPGVYYYNGRLLVNPDANATDVLIQHFMGLAAGGIGEGFDIFSIHAGTGNISRVVVDHCAFMWGGDSQGDVSGASPYHAWDIVYSHTMMGEGVPLASSPRGYIVESRCNQFTSYGCYVWNIKQRGPRIRGHVGQFYNNLYYCWTSRNVSFQSTDEGDYINQTNFFDLENNAFVRTSSSAPLPIHDGTVAETSGSSVYVAGNNLWNGLISVNTPQTLVGQWGLVRSATGITQAAVRQNYPTGLVLASALQTKNNVVSFVGPRPRYRDTNLQRIFTELANNTGSIKNAIAGYPIYIYNTTTFPASPTIGTWRDIVACSDGYNRTRLEKYLHDLEDVLL